MTELEKCKFAKENGFTYDPITGEIRGVIGQVITGKTLGYIDCKVFCGNKYSRVYGHRLAWYLHYGKLPLDQIDHIDGDKSNNRISNLREVNNQQNQWNQVNAKGYHWDKATKKFKAYLKVNKKRIFIGRFKTEEEAHNAYLEAKSKHHIIP